MRDRTVALGLVIVSILLAVLFCLTIVSESYGPFYEEQTIVRQVSLPVQVQRETVVQPIVQQQVIVNNITRVVVPRPELDCITIENEDEVRIVCDKEKVLR